MPWSQAGNIRGPQGPQGNVGPQGPQGDPGQIGPAGLTWRAAWSAANTYAVNDHVTWGGSSYYSTAPHNAGTAPPTGTSGDPGTDDTAVNAGWALLTVQGSTGPQGTQGIQGDQGIQGTPGTAGTPGTRGSQWFTGSGAPSSVPGSIVNDYYLDISNGDVYKLT